MGDWYLSISCSVIVQRWKQRRYYIIVSIKQGIRNKNFKTIQHSFSELIYSKNTGLCQRTQCIYYKPTGSPLHLILLIIEPVDFLNQHRYFTGLPTLSTIFPDSTITDTPDSLVQSDRTADASLQLCAPKGTLPQQGQPAELIRIIRIVILIASAAVQSVEINAMLGGALLDQRASGDIFILADETVGESQRPDSRGLRAIVAPVGGERQVRRAEDDHIAHALPGAVLALDLRRAAGYTAHVFSLYISYFSCTPDLLTWQ